MLYINKNRVVFSHKKRLITPILFFPLLLSLLMSSCDCDDNPLPNSFNRTGLYLTRIEIDKQNVNLNSFTPISNVSLRPSPLASFSFSFPVASIHIDSIKKYLSIVSNSDNKELPFSLSRGANDSSVYIDLPSGASLERGKSYNITLRGGLSVETDANRKFSLNKPYSVRFTSVSKSNNTDLSVSYLGNDIVASDAGVFTIDAKELTKLPVRIPLKLRVDPSSKVEEGNTSLTVKGDSVEYAIDVSSESETRTIIVMAEDGRRKQYTIVINASGAEYTVRFNTNGGSAVAAQTVKSGSKVQVPSPSPTKADSVFDTWYIDASLTRVYDFNADTRSSFTLYAKWKARPLTSSDTATVTFNTNSGSAISSVKVRKGNAVTKPTDPTRTGYRFNNWYSNSTLTTVYDFSTSVTLDVTLYAKWDTVKYTITFNTNGGDAVSSQTIHSGSKVEIPSPSPMKTTDSVLENWYSNSALTTVYDFSASVTSSLTLYAKWKFRSLASTDTATVTFNANSGSAVASAKIRKGSAITKPTDPTRTGYLFNNWYSNSTLTTIYDFNASVTSDLTLYAKWDTVKYTITFNTNGGDAVASQTIHSGSKVEVPSPSPMKTTDSVLENWYSNSALTTVYDFSASVTSSFTLYAKWKFRSLASTDTATVTFASNGGSAISSVKVRKGNAVTKPTDPTRTGYRFNNWYSNSTLTTVYDFSTSVTSDLTLYAKWDTVKYTITFNTNGGDAVASQTVNSGSKVEVPSPSPMKTTDSVLENWYSNSALTTVYDFSTSVTSNFTLYAKWKFRPLTSSDTATVTFNSNSGSAVASAKIRKGSAVTKPTDPTRTGYLFNNWYSNSTLTTVYDFNASVTSDLTLYAKWDTVKYTVTFNSNGGSAVASQNVDSGKMAVRPTNPTRANFTFNNWYSNSTLTMLYDFTTAVTGNVTLYAKWDTAKYTVTFNTAGGSAVSPQQVTSGARATPPSPRPTNNGLYFAGWFTKAVANLSDSFNFSGAIVSDTTIYAKWLNLFGYIIESGKIPDDIFQYDDPLVRETIGNGNYQAGANVAVKHVKYGGDDNNDGSSWSRAYASVSKALSDITDASRSKVYLVMVAASPNEYISGNSIRMKNNTAIIGGFTAAQDGDYTMSQTDTTILSGNNASRVFSNSALNLSALLYGVKIVKGATLTSEGGGAAMTNSNASITVTNVIFSENTSRDNSILQNIQSNGIYKNTLFINNYAATVVALFNSNSIFVNSIFAKNNQSSYNGITVGTVVTFSTISVGAFINTNFSGNTLAAQNSKSTIYVDFEPECSTCFPIVANSILSGPNNSAIPQNVYLDNQNEVTYNNFFLSNGYIYNGRNAIDPGTTATQPPYVIYENMTEQPPFEGSLGANGGFIPTMPIPSGSSAVDLGLYVKVAPPGNVVYFSEDKISWFRIGPKGTHVAATPPASAKDLTDTDARGYKRIGRPDAGAYEAGATP